MIRLAGEANSQVKRKLSFIAIENQEMTSDSIEDENA